MEDDAVIIAKSVAENYEDEELRNTFVDVSLDLSVRETLCWMLKYPKANQILVAVFSNNR